MRHAPALLTCAALSFFAACGAEEDEVEDDATIEDVSADSAKADSASTAASSTFNPFSSSSSQITAAKRWATNPRYVGVHATLASLNRSTGVRTYKWTATLRGDNNVYVDLAISPGSVRILRHETRMMFAGQGSFVKSDITFTPSKLQTKYPSRIKDLDLSEPLTAHPAAHWLVTFDDGNTRFVDAKTGAEQH